MSPIPPMMFGEPEPMGPGIIDHDHSGSVTVGDQWAQAVGGGGTIISHDHSVAVASMDSWSRSVQGVVVVAHDHGVSITVTDSWNRIGGA